VNSDGLYQSIIYDIKKHLLFLHCLYNTASMNRKIVRSYNAGSLGGHIILNVLCFLVTLFVLTNYRKLKTGC